MTLLVTTISVAQITQPLDAAVVTSEFCACEVEDTEISSEVDPKLARTLRLREGVARIVSVKPFLGKRYSCEMTAFLKILTTNWLLWLSSSIREKNS